jgi:LCP family protein required for cell wall assembly
LTRGFMTMVSMAAVLLTGAGYWVAHGALGGITVSQALSADDPRSTGSEMNILLIGLDSRKDQDGNDLPSSILKQLHAGDSDDGGYNTNTLILVHVSADNKVVAFSIPRDDWVAFNGVPGYQHIKIKEAYGLTKQYVAQKFANQGVSSQKELETKGREAGRAATLRAVRSLTGVPIDYFAEVNLAGFYDLAQALGGVEVCLKHAVEDSYSGADFPAGRQRLDASEALAFVRQRHGLENGDLDRTHRQQAFISSVMRELKDSGTFTDLDKLQSLMAVARKDVVLSAGWNEDLIQRLGGLTGGSVEFRTLPVVRYETIDGLDVNIIDPAAIKAEIAAAIGAAGPKSSPTTASKPNPATVVDVINSGSMSGLATQVSRSLKKHGYTAGQVRDRESGEPNASKIDYGVGADADAHNVADLLGLDAPKGPDPYLPPGQIRVYVDTNYTLPAVDETTTDESTTTTTTTTTTTSKSRSYGYWTSADPTPDQGKPHRRRRGAVRELGVRAAVDADFGSGDERAVLGHQHCDDPGDYGGVGHPGAAGFLRSGQDGHEPGEERPVGVLGNVSPGGIGDPGLDAAGRHAYRPQPVLRVFERQGVREGLNPALAGGVSRHVRMGERCRSGAEVHNGAAAIRQQRRQRFAHDQEGAGQVDADDLIPQLQTVLVRVRGTQDARGVDQRVEAAQRFGC